MLSRIFTLFLFFTLLLSWILPVHNRPWSNVYHELMAGLSLLFAVLAVASIKNRIYLPFSAVLVAAVAVIPLTQVFFGVIVFNSDAILSVIYIFVFSVSIFASFNLQRFSFGFSGGSFVGSFSWVLVTAVLISIFFMLHQWFRLEQSQWILTLNPGVRPSANIAQPNNLVTLLGMGLAAVFYLYEKKMLGRFAASLLTVFILFGVALTQSRTPWVVSLVLVFIWAIKQDVVGLRVRLVHVLLWIMVYAAMVLFLPFLADYLYLSAASPIDRAMQLHRLDLYMQFVLAIFKGPWYGHGWGQVFTAQYKIAAESQSYISAMYTHNVLLDILIWNGPVLGVLIIGVLVFWFLRLLVMARSNEALFAWVGLSFFVVHSMLEYPHAYTFLLIPAGFFVGILLEGMDSSKWVARLPWWSAFSVIVPGFFVVYILWTDYLVVEKNYHAAIAAFGDEDNSRYAQSLPKAYIFDGMQSYVDLMIMPVRSGYSSDEIDGVLKTAERYPIFFMLLRSAELLAVNGEVDKALEKLNAIKYLHTAEQLDFTLNYLSDKTEEHPEYVVLIERLNMQ
ncbi:MAG: Wzy polymerase domain-containing protein [Halopseudomonas yangmingensis]